MSALGRFTALFPLWAILAGFAAWARPELFAPLRGTIAPLLGLVMLGMGMTLGPADFRRVAERPGAVALGLLLQYGVMPPLGLGLAMALALPTPLLLGVVLVGACPGGTASNVLTYLARCNLALSVAAISAIVVALEGDQLGALLGPAALAVVLHNAGGLLLGYGGARLLGRSRTTARTLAIEVGMQNSGLAVALASAHFAPAAALPGAVFSVWHNVSGAVLAGFWSRRPGEER